ncbi:MAG: hypothetical protein ABIJ61_00900 [bacterium]
MNIARIAIGTGLLLATIGTAAASAQGELPAEKNVVAEAAWVPSDSTVMDKVWFLFTEEPQKQMRSTLLHLSQREQDEAARTVLTTADYLRLETIRARGAELTELQQAIAGLDKLAEQISLGDVTEPEQVGKPFNEALLALARFHYGQAQKALTRLDNREFGQELKALAAVLDYGLTSNVQGLEPNVLADLTQARTVADSLKVGDETKPDSGYDQLMARLNSDIGLLARHGHGV